MLMRQLLLLTHHQWMYRNATVHYKADGQPLPCHEQILETITNLIETDETLLLPEDRDLLHIDFAQLSECPTIDQERWISNMNTAISAVGFTELDAVELFKRPICEEVVHPASTHLNGGRLYR